MLIDTFLFWNELDLLEIRLNSLAPYVDRFVLVEAPFTHSGKPKSLYFQENKEYFKDFNITHLIMGDEFLDEDPYETEKNQREYLMKGIEDVPPDATILLSNLDEIPNLEYYRKGTEGVFRQKLYYYALNVYTGRSNWHGTIAVQKENLKSLRDLRDRRNRINVARRDGGWHFSTLGTPEQIIEKIEAFHHQEYNLPYYKKGIAMNRANMVDPYNRGGKQFFIEMPSGPEWLLKNKERYPQLWR